MKVYAVRWRQIGFSDGLEIHSNKSSAQTSFKNVITYADEASIYQYEGKDCLRANVLIYWNKYYTQK